MTGKPSVSELGIDLAAQVWQRSSRGNGQDNGPTDGQGKGQGNGPTDGRNDGAADGSIEVAFTGSSWVLMRVTGDPEQRVLVFDRHEWECFLDGARNGEFDDAADS